MIGREELLRISRITGMKPHQQEKHYIQVLTLRSIYSSHDMIFKGGTALMFSIGLDRFSEDLDFNVMGDDLDVETFLQTILKDLEYMGVQAQGSLISDMERSQVLRIGAEGPLFSREIERCYVRIDISRREKNILAPEMIFIETPYPDQLPFSVSVMSHPEILAEKFRALMTREKARDLYDVWFLLKKGVKTNLALVEEKMEYYEKSFDRGELESSIMRKRDIWKSELESLIFGRLPAFEMVNEYVIDEIKKSLFL
ncbi:MAG: nucleotidyl transferase AbiEii/AbiGii toxin family protein [Thermoplasmata archaeon]|nr:nucleotidyl transferase AbiEii/AbiGii toxin family protein [Thermoplasmata archaeon]